MAIGGNFDDLTVQLRSAINVADADFPDIYDPATTPPLPPGTVSPLITSDERLYSLNANRLPTAFNTQTETMRNVVAKDDPSQTPEAIVDLLNVVEDYFVLTDGNNLTYMTADLSMAASPSAQKYRIQNLKNGASYDTSAPSSEVAAADAITKGQIDTSQALVDAVGAAYGIPTPNVLTRQGTPAMSANLNLGAKRLKTVGDIEPEEPDSTGANKGYVTSSLVLSADDYWLLDGSNYALDSLDLGTFYIQTLGNPAPGSHPSGYEPQDVVNQQHCDTRIVASNVMNATLPAGMVMPWGCIDQASSSSPWDSPPDGWVFCDGQGYPKTGAQSHPALLSVIGTRFNHTNDDPNSVMRVPDLRGRAVAGFDNMALTNNAGRLTDAWFDETTGSGPQGPPQGPAAGRINRPWDQFLPATWNPSGGDATPTEAHRVLPTELTSHTHDLVNGLLYNETAVSGGQWPASTGSASVWRQLPPPGGTPDTQTQGGGSAHQNVQPTLAIAWIIKV
jgi:microcystin-dependent protein